MSTSESPQAYIEDLRQLSNQYQADEDPTIAAEYYRSLNQLLDDMIRHDYETETVMETMEYVEEENWEEALETL